MFQHLLCQQVISTNSQAGGFCKGVVIAVVTFPALKCFAEYRSWDSAIAEIRESRTGETRGFLIFSVGTLRAYRLWNKEELKFRDFKIQHPTLFKENLMADFTIHNAETAPQGSKQFIDNAQKQFGMVPNLIGLLAESPTAVETYQTLATLFKSSSFTPTERNVVWLTIIYENECHYCMAAHTGIAKNEKVATEIIEAIRNGTVIPDTRLESLRSFTSSLVANRGWVDSDEVDEFLAAGFTKENVFDVLVGISHKILSNYSNHITTTPVDAAFQKFTWEKNNASVS